MALFGDQAPKVGKVLAPVGFKLVRVNVKTGEIEDFAVNKGRLNGPASALGHGGLERPLAARFSPDGSALYLVEFRRNANEQARELSKKGDGSALAHHPEPIMKKLLVFSAAAVLLLGCSARRSEPLKGSLSLADARLHTGRIVFMANCHKCHPGGEAGQGPSLNDKPLPKALMALQVRVGLGAMPSFSREQISNQELGALLDYLKVLRRK